MTRGRAGWRERQAGRQAVGPEGGREAVGKLYAFTMYISVAIADIVLSAQITYTVWLLPVRMIH